ncbi:MAG: class I SAM-dependent methyltransferase [Candidatus Solibacter usitatus]|nr:class I SAM-dependent methyltransferase [Candidatus Solibacter usitatus]
MQDGLFTVHNDHFRDDPAFRAAYKRGVLASMGVDPAFEWRVHVALWAASTAIQAPGDFVECGVNAGFISSAIMHHLRWESINRRFLLIDTFNGPVLQQFSDAEVEQGRLKLAEASLRSGAYVTDMVRVSRNFSEWPNAVVVPGEVPQVLSKLDVGAVAFLHIDMNCAFPERAAREHFWERISPRGIVLRDDYAYFGHEEQAEEMDKAAVALGTKILSLPTGQGLIVKH